MTLIVSRTVVVTLVCLSSGVCVIELTLDDKQFGSDVVRASIAKLDYMFGSFDHSDFWQVAQSPFMRILAYVESLDNESIVEPSSYRNDGTI